MNKSLNGLLEAHRTTDYKELIKLGEKLGKLYTDHGFPLDMALDRLPYGKQEKIMLIDGACQWFMEHKRLSGATEKSLERQRKANREMITNFLDSGEVGVY